MNGTVKKVVAEKNFGFISTAEGDKKDYFFHASACTGVDFSQLQIGTAVSFDIEEDAKSEKGPRAINVALAEAA